MSARRDDAPVWVVTTEPARADASALEARGVRVLVRARARGARRLAWALRALRAAGLWSLMVEGGSELLGAFLAARLFDQVALFRAPLLLGGRGSRPAFGGPGSRAPVRRRPPHGAQPDPARAQPAVSPAVAADGGYEVWYPAAARYGRTR